jgi:hypothetical protein
VIEVEEKDGRAVFRVRVSPRASRSAVAGVSDGTLRVRIAAPPVDGAANEELVAFLAKRLGVPKSAVGIVAGQASKLKTIAVAGLGADEVARALQ